jgi:hypothetical protein
MMKNNKNLGYIIFGIGILLSVITLLLLPIPAYGLYLILGNTRPDMNKFIRILVAIFGSFIIVMGIASIVSFMM